jgi:hypothetical protein
MNKRLTIINLFLIFTILISGLVAASWNFDPSSTNVTISSLGITSLSSILSSTESSDVNITSLSLTNCGNIGLTSYTVPFNITANANTTLSYGLNVTNTVTPTTYTCNLNAGNSTSSTSLTLNVNVSEIDEFTVSDFGLPSSLDVDTDYNGSFTITNDGNIVQNFIVSFSEKEDYDSELDLTLTDSSGTSLSSGFNTGDISIGASYTINYTFSPNEDLVVFHNENMGYTLTFINGNGDTQSKDLVTKLGSNEFDISIDIDPNDELEPGEDFTVEVTIDNTVGFDLEDVQVKVWIQDIDDTKDLKLESTKFSLGSGDDKTKSFDFEIPYNVDEDEYNILVRVEGEDEDDSSNDFRFYELFKNELTVDKDEDEDVVFLNFEASVNTLTCGTLFTVYSDIINVGSDDLDDMYVKLILEDLSLEYTSEEFDLDSKDSDDRETQLQFLVSLPSDLSENSYTLKFEAYTESADIFDIGYETLPVISCSDDSEDDTEETTDDSENNTEDSGVVYYPTGFSIAEWFTTENAKLSFWVIGDLALLAIAVYFISLIFRKKR